MAGNLPYHPAPGLGDLLPGYFVVPQNPVINRAPVTVAPGIGDIIRGSFPVPQNPIKAAVTGNVKPLGTGDCGCGCGGSGGCAGGKTGMINGQRVGVGDISSDFTAFTGDLSAGNFAAALQAPIMGVPAWVFGMALIAIPMLMPGSNLGVSRRRR